MSFLTDHREIHLEVLGRRVLEVHPASVDALVVQLDRLQGERGRLRHGDEVGPGSHGGAVRPVQGLVESSSPHVETARILHRLLNNSKFHFYLFNTYFRALRNSSRFFPDFLGTGLLTCKWASLRNRGTKGPCRLDPLVWTAQCRKAKWRYGQVRR